MRIKQLSIFVENKTGRLHSIIDALSKANVNLRALSIADTTDFGILRVIVDDSDAAKAVLSEIGVISKITDVIAVKIDDKTGGLASVLDTLSDSGIFIEYMYAFLGREAGRALMVLKSSDDDAAAAALTAAGIALTEQSEI
ncbi:MAG: hypothetical protein IKB38_03110 [Clostridia bacterium]|nr:hypothetical protein [Clostridia bacterium]